MQPPPAFKKTKVISVALRQEHKICKCRICVVKKVYKWAVFSSNSIWPDYCIRSSADLNCRIGSCKSSINTHLPTCSFPSAYGLLVYVQGTEKRLQSCGFANGLLLKGGLLLSEVHGAWLFLMLGPQQTLVPTAMQEAKVSPPVPDFLTAVSEYHHYAVARHQNLKAGHHP